MTRPTEKEINDLLNNLAERIEKGGTRFRNMTYEQGVEAGVRWIIDGSEHPYGDDTA